MKFEIGDKAYWNDPDDGLCSCEVTIIDIRDEYVILKNAYGSEFEAYADELSKLS